MARIGLVFPGQGAQKPGMGKDIYTHFPQAQKRMDQAQAILGFDLKTMCFEGTAEDLKKTENTQPALYMVSFAIYESIIEAIKSQGHELIAYAGHSLGEYSAYAAAGYVSYEDGLRMVRRRGELMAEADPEGRGTMASILKLDDEVVESICQELSTKGVIIPANYNSPGQVAISGERHLVEEAVQLAKEKKGKGLMLPVGGAFHSPLMEPASLKLEEFINSISFQEQTIPVISNVTATPVPFNDIKQSLVKQLRSPVRWSRCVEKMVDMGVDTFIELGTGNVLQGLIGRIAKDVRVFGVQDKDTFDETLNSLS
jgi:[acyl-carrier-protein] S-malonyltransferase